MKLRKFSASNMKEAIAKVKAELGADAMIVATRELRRPDGMGVEVTAAIDHDEKPAKSTNANANANGTSAANAIAGTPSPGGSKPSAVYANAALVANLNGNAPLAPPAPVCASISEQDIERIMAPLRSELRTLRAQMPVAPKDDSLKIENELSSMRAAIARLTNLQRIPRATNARTVAKTSVIALPSSCRGIALVGPTGAGKTTTIAKIAAREALVAKKSVALLTLDTYRIGGEDQIRIFADLIGVPLAVARSLDELPRAFHQLARYDRVLIDTAGRSPRDKNAIAETMHALRSIAEVETHLVLPAATHRSMIDACFDRYGSANIDRLLMTKVDEANDLNELVDAPARTERPVSYITTGQRVPEDIEDATWDRLLALAERGFEAAEEVAA